MAAAAAAPAAAAAVLVVVVVVLIVLLPLVLGKRCPIAVCVVSGVNFVLSHCRSVTHTHTLSFSFFALVAQMHECRRTHTHRTLCSALSRLLFICECK